MKTGWHIISPEYPPQIGGVGDYARGAARELERLGEEVHVWYPGSAPLPDGYTPSGLARLSRAIDSTSAPRRLFVQYVPHGYGYKSMNLAFAWWLWRRSLGSDEVDLMIHEPFLPLRRSDPWTHNAAALVHRLMMILALRAATRVWITIPRWEKEIKPFFLGDSKPVVCIPVPSNVPPVKAPEAKRAAAQLFGNALPVIGHFGTFSPYTKRLLAAIMGALPAALPVNILLLGHGSDQAAASFKLDRLRGLGAMDSKDLSAWIQACDILLQPYEDGVSARRGSTMAALSHGKPIVTTFGESSEDYWPSSNAVWHTPCASIPEMAPRLASGVMELLGDHQLREDLGRRALALYSSKFSIERMVAALLSPPTESSAEARPHD